MNLDAWNALAAPDQAAVLDAAAVTADHQWKELRTRVARNYEAMRAQGVTVTTDVAPELAVALRRAGQVVVDEWRAAMGPSGQEILDGYRQRRAGR